jgi:hypothetical protein
MALVGSIFQLLLFTDVETVVSIFSASIFV